MALTFPDIVNHNNPDRSIVDADFVRGGARTVSDLTALYALYALKPDQLKQYITKIYVQSEQRCYLLIDTTQANGVNGWKDMSVSTGGNVSSLNDITLTSLTYGQTLFYNSDTTKWVNSYIFKDSGKINSLNYNSRTLFDNSGADVFRWNDRSMINSSNIKVADFSNNCELFDSLGNSSLSSDSRHLKNVSEVTTLDWDSTELYDPTTNFVSLDWLNRFLKATDGTNSINYGVRTLLASDNSAVMDWNLTGNSFYKHLTGRGSTVTISANAGLGTGGSLTPSGYFGNDIVGQISFTTGTGIVASTTLVDVLFANTHFNPMIFLSIGSNSTACFYVSSVTIHGFSISTSTSLSASQTYSINYFVINIA